MTKQHSDHPDFWGREGRGGEEWDVVDQPAHHPEEPAPKFFEKPKRSQAGSKTATPEPPADEPRQKP
jgi:hypothetical protein